MPPKQDDNAYVALCSPRAIDTVPAVDQDACTTHSRSGSERVDDRHDDPDPPAGGDGGAPKKVALWELYRFATSREIGMLVLACIFACVNGVLYPCMALVFGHAMAAFDPFDQHAVNRAALEYLAIAVALLVTDYFTFALFGSLSERQAKAMRESYLRRLLFMDMSWYDMRSDKVLQFSSGIASDTITIKNGMGPKLGDSIKFTGQCVGGFVIGFARSWDLALVMSCVAPVSMLSMTYLIDMVRKLTKTTQNLYAEAGAVAEETLSSMRTVASLNGEQRAIERYDAKTRLVEEGTIDIFRRAGIVQGIFTSSVWLMYGVGLWYGGWKVSAREMPPATVFQAFFGITLGTWSLGQITPSVLAVADAQTAAWKFFDVLDSQSLIDASSDSGLRPPASDGDLVFHDIHFAYPSRPDAPVLRGLHVTIGPRETVAFVGLSGGGKSTIIALLERFYDPQFGTITLDGHDLRDLNVSWLRTQIGLVSQQPVLFAMSIFDNIATGCASLESSEPVSEEKRKAKEEEVKAKVEAAARLANAHDFIMQLPEGYDTSVGENGTSLSGGQKQRIAIARAIVRQPRFLVLDEATSALDNESERVVQEALTNVMQSERQMATIVIAHRLSTVRAADKIVAMDDGQVAEVGTHAQLMAQETGIYRSMVEMQALEEQDEAADPVQQDATNEQIESAAVADPVDDAVVENHVDLPRDDRQDANAASKFTISDAMRLSAPESKFYAVGMVAAIVHGLSVPCSALLVSAVAAMLTEKYGEFVTSGNHKYLHEIAASARDCGVIYLLGACVVGSVHWVQVYCFRLMAAKLTSRLRHLHFLSICRQDIAFFDEEKNSTGALTANLVTKAGKVSLASGDAQGKLVQAATTLIVAVLVAFVSGSWVLSLIMLVILPFLLFGEVIRARYSNGKMLTTDDLSIAGAEASQALNNVRTVVAFGLEDKMHQRFSRALEEPMYKGKLNTKVTGLSVGYSSFVIFATYALVFWYGGVLVSQEKITFRELIRTLIAIIMSSQGVGFAASWAAEAHDALKAGNDIFDVRDRPHAIDALREDDGQVLENVQGRLELRNVVFRYPTRPELPVLDDFNLVIEANETIGFCGTSGGGKSTVVALVERFYDPVGGQVLLDGHDLRELRVSWLRRQIGYVGQEPTLFIGTIAENIAYGLDYAPSQEEIVRVARLANAHDFIVNLPEGYNTPVGARGDQVSGGQKQRIAIARAVLRNPRILILDEATSALDSESERVVQEALDSVVATQQCTTLIIAHRLSTLRSADRICVVDHGRVADIGSHDELAARDGLYARLLNGGGNRRGDMGA